MILLGLSGIMLFAVSVAALAVPQKFQEDVFRPVWRRFGDDLKTTLQNHLDCCGFDEGSAGEVNCSIGHPFCNTSVLLKVSSLFIIQLPTRWASIRARAEGSPV